MAENTVDEHVLCIVPYPEPTSVTNRLRQAFPGIEITFITAATGDEGFAGTASLPEDTFRDATVLATIWALPPSIDAAPRLRHIHMCCAGYNHVADHPVVRDPAVTVTTSSGIHGTQIAEWVVMTALAHAHQYSALYELQQQHTWGSHAPFASTVSDMAGQRIGILGYGSIGRQVGRVAQALGMDVIAFTTTARPTPESRACRAAYTIAGTGDPDGTIPSRWFSGRSREAVRAFLAQDIDVLVVSLPLTDDTRRLLSHEEFRILGRRRAFVSNVARGAIIDQEALIAALQTGQLRGAALDVADPEPLPPEHPLWQAPNVFISPHLSGLTRNYMERALAVLEANLERKRAGQALLNVVLR